jgi:L-ascorbate metabolism protein UlaG (beta-lactamase superfamily)
VIEPFLADDAFLADVEAVKDRPGLHLWWLGQSGFLARWKSTPDAGSHDLFLLFDPYLSDSLTAKYAGTDKPHVRMTRRVVAPERLGFVDVVTSSHNHTDHLDADTLKPLLRANSGLYIVVPAANLEFVAERLGVNVHPEGEPLVPMDEGIVSFPDGEEITQNRFSAVPAAHEKVELDEQGRCKFLGYVTEFGEPPITVYHSGDTVLYDGMVDRLRPFNIDVALLPINGRSPERRVAGNLNGREAAWLAKEIGAKLVIPCHYEMFEFNTASPDEFVAECERLGQPYRVLRAGERFSSSEMPGIAAPAPPRR